MERGWFQQHRRPLALVAAIAIFHALPAAAGACTGLDVADAAIEIVPTECSFWRQAGIIRAKGAAAGASGIRWERDCGVPIGHREIRFSGPGEEQMGVDEWLEVCVCVCVCVCV